MHSRIEHLRTRMAEQQLPALLVTKWENILYLSGFSGSSGALIVTDDQLLLISDFRYVLQAEQESPDWTFIRCEYSLFEAISRVLSDLPMHRIGYEPDALSVSNYHRLTVDQEIEAYTLHPAPGMVEALRLTKDAEELACIREAVRITDDAYAYLTTLVSPGVTEQDLALAAEWYMRQHGAEGVAFSLIVATGTQSALPHAQPGPRALQAGDLVVVDMGARYAHYCADMTRTFAVAEARPIAQDIYRICTTAQLEGMRNIKPGMTGREADGIVRAVIAEAGYGEFFGHGTGHGVGLEIHEAPRLSLKTEEALPVGATVTVEPGIYLPDVGGVRIEDLAIMTDSGVQALTMASKPLELPVFG